MTRRIGRRHTVFALVVVLMCGLALTGPVWLASAKPISPQDQKDAIRQACDDSGGSFVEDANTDTYRCNLKDGGAIVCSEGTNHCWYEPAKALQGILGNVVAVGNGNLSVNPGSAVNPTPTATPTKGKVNVGGITITKPGSAKLPPDTVSLFGRAWTCPANISHDFQTLFAKCNPNNSIGFAVNGAGLPETFANGGFTYNGVAPGQYTVRELVPNGYGVDLTTYCATTSSAQYPGASAFSLAPNVVQGWDEFSLQAGQYNYCEWFNVPPSSAGQSPTPLPGPRSGIVVTLWDCPLQAPTVPLRGPGTPAPPPSNCHTEDNVTNQAVFLVGGPGVAETTIHGSGILMNGLPAGKYFIRLTTIPTGYSKPVGYCGFAPSEEQGPNGWTQVGVADGYTVEIPQDQTLYCDWYITYSPANAPLKPAVASPVPPAAATPAA